MSTRQLMMKNPNLKVLPELIVPAVKELRTDVDKYSTSIKFLQGETGCPAQLEYGHALRNLEWDEYSQAKWDLRQALTHFSMGIPYSFFTMVDLNYGWMLQSFGLVRMNGNKEAVYYCQTCHEYVITVLRK